MRGFSILQLIIIVSMAASLAALLTIAPNPGYLLARYRDTIRISDLSSLVVAIDSYISDFGVPPDLPNVARVSNRPVSKNSKVENSQGRGWIGGKLSPYIFRLKRDPVNSPPFVYRYIHDSSKFKLDVVLEAETHLMKNSVDGGIDDNYFEAGTGKDLVIGNY